jgi:hypothetical protein
MMSDDEYTGDEEEADDSAVALGTSQSLEV